MRVLAICFVLVLAVSWTAAGCAAPVAPVAKEVVKAGAKKAGRTVVKEADKKVEEWIENSVESSTNEEEDKTTPTPSRHVVLQVVAQKIIDDYGEDRSEADEKYKGAVLQVSGEIARVKKDDVHYIIFDIKGGPDNVRCNLAPGQVDKWERLNEGDRVVVVGTGVGKNTGHWGDFNLDACTLNPASG